MKATIFLVLTATAVSSVFAGSLFSEKEEAKAAVNEKYKEVETLVNKLGSNINDEKNKPEEGSKKQAMDTLTKGAVNTKMQLNKNVREYTKTAIVKGKPIQVIECIGATSTDGENLINNANEILKAAIENVLKLKLKKLESLQLQIKLIFDASDDLKGQDLKKIEKLESGFEPVKAEAARKVETAKKQLHEIETRITNPSLVNEYANVRKQIENKFKEISADLLKKLQKCVG